MIKQDIIDSLKEDGSNLKEVCNLNFVDSNYNENQYYVNLIAGNKIIEYSVDESDNLALLCGTKGDNVPGCFNKKVGLLDENSKFVFFC